MLQRVPPEGGYTVIADDVEDGWRRAMVLMSSATAGRAGRSRIAAAAPVVPAVPRGRRAGVRDPPARSALPLLARAHRRHSALVPDGRHRGDARRTPVTTVTCEFCNTRYEFTPGRSGAAELVATSGKFPVRREYVVLRAAPVEKTGEFRRCRAKFPRSEQGDFRSSSGSRYARSGELRVPSLPVLPGSGSPMLRLSSAHNATRVWRF